MTLSRNFNPKTNVGNSDPNTTEPRMNPAHPHLDDPTLQALASGELPPQEALRVQGHLEDCAECRGALAHWERLVVSLERLPELMPPPAFENAVMARVLPPNPNGAATRHLAPQGIQRHLMGELSPEQSAGVQAHLSQCDACRDVASEWQTLFGALRALPAPSPRAGFEDRVMARVPIDAIARVFAAEQRPWQERVQDQIRGWMPRARRTWILLGAAMVLPAMVPILLAALVLTNPALSLRDLVLFLQWQLLGLGEGLGTLWRQLPGSGIVTLGIDRLVMTIQQIPTEGLLLAFIIAALVIATSASILFRSLLLPALRGRSHAS